MHASLCHRPQPDRPAPPVRDSNTFFVSQTFSDSPPSAVAPPLKCAASSEAAAGVGGAGGDGEEVRTASRACRRDERRSGASRHPERVLRGEGAMEGGEWLQHNGRRVPTPPTTPHTPPRPLPCLPALSSQRTAVSIINRPLFRRHRASHVSHLSSGWPRVESPRPGRGRRSARPRLKIAQCGYFEFHRLWRQRSPQLPVAPDAAAPSQRASSLFCLHFLFSPRRENCVRALQIIPRA